MSILPLFIIPGMLKKAVDGIGGLGDMFRKIGDTAGKAVSGLGKKYYDNTALGRGRAIRSQARAEYRNQKFATSMGKKYGVRKYFARGVPINGAGRYANKRLESFANDVVNAADTKAVAAEESLYETQIQAGDKTIEQVYNDAVKAKDEVGARAALNILMKTAGGRNKAHALLKDTETRSPSMTKVLKAHIAATNPGIDANDAVIGDWSHNKGDMAALETHTATEIDPSTGLPRPVDSYKINETKMAGQTIQGLTAAYNSGQLTQAAANRILADPIARNIRPDELAFLQELGNTGAVPIAMQKFFP